MRPQCAQIAAMVIDAAGDGHRDRCPPGRQGQRCPSQSASDHESTSSTATARMSAMPRDLTSRDKATPDGLISNWRPAARHLAT